jgi:hypothetical protein
MKLPTPPPLSDNPTQGYLTNLVKTLTTILSTKLDSNTAVGSVLLASPDGSVYTVQVTNAGVITATKVFQG